MYPSLRGKELIGGATEDTGTDAESLTLIVFSLFL